jgi:hypothetical protein
MRILGICLSGLRRAWGEAPVLVDTTGNVDASISMVQIVLENVMAAAIGKQL